jgi:hypothetical protein
VTFTTGLQGWFNDDGLGMSYGMWKLEIRTGYKTNPENDFASSILESIVRENNSLISRNPGSN